MRGSVLSEDHELRIARMRREALRRKPKEPDHREFVSGFIRLHILHHAAQEPLVGFWMIEELRRHGYDLQNNYMPEAAAKTSMRAGPFHNEHWIGAQNGESQFIGPWNKMSDGDSFYYRPSDSYAS
jgi:hypothetical protein